MAHACCMLENTATRAQAHTPVPVHPHPQTRTGTSKCDALLLRELGTSHHITSTILKHTASSPPLYLVSVTSLITAPLPCFSDQLHHSPSPMFQWPASSPPLSHVSVTSLITSPLSCFSDQLNHLLSAMPHHFASPRLTWTRPAPPIFRKGNTNCSSDTRVTSVVNNQGTRKTSAIHLYPGPRFRMRGAIVQFPLRSVELCLVKHGSRQLCP
jgi:hypothetical protein